VAALLVILLGASLAVAASGSPANAGDDVSFFKDVSRPAAEQLHRLSSAGQARWEYVMTDFATLLKGGESGSAVSSGTSEKATWSSRLAFCGKRRCPRMPRH